MTPRSKTTLPEGETKVQFADGKAFKKMFSVGTRWLERAVPDINAINVFPVPDGDTGTNMLLTMRSAVEEAGTHNGEAVGVIARSMAYGALMGARGNSGVILSQFWRGFADALEGKETLDGRALADALSKAADTAYGGLVHPVEGTILTVLRNAATAASATAEHEDATLLEVLESAVQTARETVAATPDLLPVLKEAGVVDAGAQGFYVLLDGALSTLNGRDKGSKGGAPDLVAVQIEPLQHETPTVSATQVEVPYGYCTNFVLQARNLDVEKISRRLRGKGQSLVVSANGSTEASVVRVHIHTFKPGQILEFASKLGTLHQIEIHNMDDQYADYIKLQRSRLPQVDTAIVTIATGDGLFDVLSSLGATIVVPGGQTMNPSVRQILQAVDLAPSDHVILLPNNKNIVLTADQVDSLSDKRVHVVPTRTIPQGIAALLAFNYDLGAEENARNMTEAIQNVNTVEIARAVRKSEMNGTKVRKGQYIAIQNDRELIAAGDALESLVFESLEKIGTAEAELVTLYWGSEVDATTAQSIRDRVHEHYGIEVELVNGGQPHYDFIISVE